MVPRVVITVWASTDAIWCGGFKCGAGRRTFGGLSSRSSC